MSGDKYDLPQSMLRYRQITVPLLFIVIGVICIFYASRIDKAVLLGINLLYIAGIGAFILAIMSFWMLMNTPNPYAVPYTKKSKVKLNAIMDRSDKEPIVIKTKKYKRQYYPKKQNRERLIDEESVISGKKGDIKWSTDKPKWDHGIDVKTKDEGA